MAGTVNDVRDIGRAKVENEATPGKRSAEQIGGISRVGTVHAGIATECRSIRIPTDPIIIGSQINGRGTGDRRRDYNVHGDGVRQAADRAGQRGIITARHGVARGGDGQGGGIGRGDRIDGGHDARGQTGE